MATKTRRDLVNQALADLGIIAAGQDPATEDFDTVDDLVEATIAMLIARDLQVPEIDDVNADEIPLEVFLPLAVLLAHEAARKFGLVGVPGPQGLDQRLEAETRLREIGYSRGSYQPQQTLWF